MWKVKLRELRKRWFYSKIFVGKERDCKKMVVVARKTVKLTCPNQDGQENHVHQLMPLWVWQPVIYFNGRHYGIPNAIISLPTGSLQRPQALFKNILISSISLLLHHCFALTTIPHATTKNTPSHFVL